MPSTPVTADSATGTWKAENVPLAPWIFDLKVTGTVVTGSVRQTATAPPEGAKADLIGPFEILDGTVQGGVLSFKCRSADRERTVALTGNVAGDEIIFTRTVTVQEGSQASGSGIFDPSGTHAFIVTRGAATPPASAQPPQPDSKQPSADNPATDKPSNAKPAGDNPAGSNPSKAASPKPEVKPADGDAKTDTSKSGGDPNYDPFHAAQDIDVGLFYLHKGDYDAAIDRFKDAIRLKPNFARPRLLLGEVYEKKGQKADAIRYYKEFLQILPDGPDSKKVRSRLEKLGAK